MLYLESHIKFEAAVSQTPEDLSLSIIYIYDAVVIGLLSIFNEETVFL